MQRALQAGDGRLGPFGRARLVDVDVAGREGNLDAMPAEVVPGEPVDLALDPAVVLVRGYPIPHLVTDSRLVVVDDAYAGRRIRNEALDLREQALQDGNDLVGGHVIADADAEHARVRRLGEAVVEDAVAGHLVVGHGEGVAVPGAQARRPPGDLLHFPVAIADLHPIPHAERRFRVEGDAREEVPEAVLQREADHRADHRRGAEKERQLDPEPAVGDHGRPDAIEKDGDHAVEQRGRRRPPLAAEDGVEGDADRPHEQDQEREQDQQEDPAGSREPALQHQDPRAEGERGEGERPHQRTERGAQPREPREREREDQAHGEHQPQVAHGEGRRASPAAAARSARTAPATSRSRKGRMAARPRAPAPRAAPAVSALTPPMA